MSSGEGTTTGVHEAEVSSGLPDRGSRFSAGAVLECRRSGFGSGRVESIDLLRGLVMVLMALDHTREFFAPRRLQSARRIPTLPCSSLVGSRISALGVRVPRGHVGGSYYGTRGRTKREVSWFLFTRGLWLVLPGTDPRSLRLDFQHSYPTWSSLQVIWAIGVSMVVLSGLLYLPGWAVERVRDRP